MQELICVPLVAIIGFGVSIIGFGTSLYFMGKRKGLNTGKESMERIVEIYERKNWNMNAKQKIHNK